MKKIMLFWLSWYPMLGLAVNDPCVYLKIKIKNQTQSTCALVGIKLDSGMVPEQNINGLPLMIPAGQAADSFTVSESSLSGVDLSLTYDCGENKTIKLNMQKGLCRINAIVEGSVMYAYHLDAQFEASNGLYWSVKPGIIAWTISDIPVKFE